MQRALQKSLSASLLCALWALSLVWLSAPQRALAEPVKLTMSSSTARVQTGEPFAVQIRAELNGVDSDDVEFTLPEFDKFEVLSRRVARPFSFSFGFGTGGQHAQTRSEVIYTFTLRALSAGKVTIPPAVASVKGKKVSTRPLNIEVSGSPLPGSGLPGAGPSRDPFGDPTPPQDAAPPSGPLDGATYDPEMFVRTVVDRKQAYVGEQVTVTIYLYVRGGLRETPMVTREATNEGFWAQDLLPTQRALSATRQEVNGRIFSTYVLRRYAAFPMRAGKLEIGAPSVETSAGNSIFDLLNGPSQSIRRTGVPVTVEAKELPARPAGSSQVHVGQLSLTASLDHSQGKVGDAMTLRIVAEGDGNLRALKLEPAPIPNVDILPPEVDDKLTTDLDKVGGQRILRFLLLPRAGGTFVIPPIRVDAFDPKSESYTRVETKPLTLQVSGEPAPSDAQAGAAKSADPSKPATTSAPSFGPVRATSALARKTPPVYEAPWFIWALLLGPFALLCALIGRRAHGLFLARQAAAQQRDQGLKTARKQLAQAREAHARGDVQATLSSLGHALKLALETQLKEPIGGFTRPALRTHLKQRGMREDLADSLVEQLEHLDHQRFTPNQDAEASRVLIEKVASCLSEIERFSPKVSP